MFKDGLDTIADSDSRTSPTTGNPRVNGLMNSQTVRFRVEETRLLPRAIVDSQSCILQLVSCMRTVASQFRNVSSDDVADRKHREWLANFGDYAYTVRLNCTLRSSMRKSTVTRLSAKGRIAVQVRRLGIKTGLACLIPGPVKLRSAGTQSSY